MTVIEKLEQEYLENGNKETIPFRFDCDNLHGPKFCETYLCDVFGNLRGCYKYCKRFDERRPDYSPPKLGGKYGNLTANCD